MIKKNHNTIFAGVAIAAGIAGIIATIFLSKPKKISTHWASTAQDAASKMMASLRKSQMENFNKKFLIGSIAGGLVGAVTALLFTPKAGKDLINDITQSLQHNGERFGIKKVFSRIAKPMGTVKLKKTGIKKKANTKTKSNVSKKNKIVTPKHNHDIHKHHPHINEHVKGL
ncbi:MAG: YtxH domain-containing protein [Parachlamydiaceae bacterium]|nr:YtxH domain-containing protein [Parachlamydiaceae bacterium]